MISFAKSPRTYDLLLHSTMILAFVSLASAAAFGQCLKPGVKLTKALMEPFTYYPVGVADFNGDGKPDLAVAKNGGKVSILLGDGAGGFSAPVDYTVGDGLDFHFGDLNGDGKADMLFIHGTSMDVWLNNGSGVFSFQSTVTQTTYLALEIADITGDGKGDLVSLVSDGAGEGYLFLRVGNGAGAFSGAIAYFGSMTSFPMKKILLGDYNGDGRIDIAGSLEGTAPGPPAVKARLFLNDGMGGLTTTTPTDIGPARLRAAGDLNGDGKTDLIGIDRNGATISVLINDGSGSFAPSVIPVRSNPNQVLVVDLNGDAKKDLLLDYDDSALPTNAGSSILLGNGVGGFTRVDLTKPNLNFFFTGDFDGDNKTDFITYHNQSLTREGLVGLWSGTCSAVNDTRVIDYNGDGMTETAVFIPSTGWWYTTRYLTDIIITTPFGSNGDIPVPGDFDGDGKTDKTVFRPSTNVWYSLRSTDGVVTYLQFGQTGDKPVQGDYDGDGKSDIAVYRPSQGAWYILRSSDQVFLGIQFGINTDAPVPSDYDGDGKIDVAIFRSSTASWYLLNSSTGAFSGIQWGVSGDRGVPADYDGDGKADVAVFRPSSGDWYILRSYNGALLPYHWGQSGDIPSPMVYFKEGYWSVPTVWRPSTRTWWSIAGHYYGANQLGSSGDIPVSTPYIVQ